MMWTKSPKTPVMKGKCPLKLPDRERANEPSIMQSKNKPNVQSETCSHSAQTDRQKPDATSIDWVLVCSPFRFISNMSGSRTEFHLPNVHNEIANFSVWYYWWVGVQDYVTYSLCDVLDIILCNWSGGFCVSVVAD